MYLRHGEVPNGSLNPRGSNHAFKNKFQERKTFSVHCLRYTVSTYLLCACSRGMRVLKNKLASIIRELAKKHISISRYSLAVRYGTVHFCGSMRIIKKASGFEIARTREEYYFLFLYWLRDTVGIYLHCACVATCVFSKTMQVLKFLEPEGPFYNRKIIK